jgi:hypothetical protein
MKCRERHKGINSSIFRCADNHWCQQARLPHLHHEISLAGSLRRVILSLISTTATR